MLIDLSENSAVANPAALDAAGVKEIARTVGFDLVGIAPATLGLGSDRLAKWLADGKHGEMKYMAEHESARGDPNMVLDGVVSIVVVATVYRTADPAAAGAENARVSRYAWGSDYHDVLRDKLLQLQRRIVETRPNVRCRAVVDSAPLMERDYAQLAGLGWFGKNTLLLNRELGSWFFLGGLLLNQPLEYDVPFATDHCGSCTRCLDACPTQAFAGPYQLDPRRCISYLTIEHRSSIPSELRDGIGSWVYGCDVCQDVCPWNERADRLVERGRSQHADNSFRPAPGMNPIAIADMLAITDADFRRRFRGTPLFRVKRPRMVRNAAIVAGNRRDPQFLPALKTLCDDPDPIIREAAGWAIAKIDSAE